jgi:dynein heavy chain
MSDELDSMFYSLLINKVPDNWKKYAYPSLKPLNSWIKDLSERVNFIRNWFTEGTVNSYWMSSFFFPQGFLTGVLQEYARHPDRQIAIDELVFSFKFT